MKFIIGRKDEVNDKRIDLNDYRDSILLVGGTNQTRSNYLSNLLVNLATSNNRRIFVYTGKEDYTPNVLYNVYPYSQFESDLIDINKIIKEREVLFHDDATYQLVSEYHKKIGEEVLPELVYVFEDIPFIPLNASKVANISRIDNLLSLFKLENHLKDLGIRLIVSTDSIRLKSLMDSLVAFNIRFYLGGCHEVEEVFLVGDPYHLSNKSHQLIFTYNELKPVLLSLPISNPLPKWIKNEYRVIKNRDCPDYIYLSEYLCLSCLNEHFPLFKYHVCPNCNDEIVISITFGKLFLDAIYILNKKYDIYKDDIEDKVKEYIVNKSRLVKNNKALTLKDYYPLLDSEFNKVFKFYLNEFKRYLDFKSKYNKVTIKEVEIHKLFNNESFLINFESEESLSILYGTNAFGKTTLLKMMHAFLSNINQKESVMNFINLESIPFDYMKISFTNGSYIIAKKKSINSIVFNYYSAFTNEELKEVEINNNSKAMSDNIANHFTSLHRLLGIDHNTLFIASNRLMDADELIRYLTVSLSNKQKITEGDISYSNLKKIYKSFSKRSNITDLEKYINRGYNTLLTLISDCKEEIRSIVNNFNNDDIRAPLSNESFEKLKELITFNFLPENSINIFNDIEVSGGDHKLFNLDPVVEEYYVKINGILNDLYNLYKEYQLFKDLFESFYNDYNPSKKVISLKNGKVLIMSSSNGVISYDKLSSGEVNVLSILFSLVFKIYDGLILLIDEPEISLHISWQVKLMKIITDLTNSNDNVQVIIATHSPYIGTYHDDSIAEVTILDD